MEPNWIPGGFRVDSGWIPDGFRLGAIILKKPLFYKHFNASGWIPGGFRVDSGWIPAGFRLGAIIYQKSLFSKHFNASGWISGGFRVDSGWIPGCFQNAFRIDCKEIRLDSAWIPGGLRVDSGSLPKKVPGGFRVDSGLIPDGFRVATKFPFSAGRRAPSELHSKWAKSSSLIQAHPRVVPRAVTMTAQIACMRMPLGATANMTSASSGGMGCASQPQLNMKQSSMYRQLSPDCCASHSAISMTRPCIDNFLRIVPGHPRRLR